jgi:hypothetical protein
MQGQTSWLTENAERKARWAHILEGGKIDPNDRIERRDVRILTEVLLDNMKRYLKEDTSTTGMVTPFTTFAFPLVRRVFPRLLANDLFSIQPMTQPTGKIFFFDTKYTGGDRRDQKATFNKAYASTGEGASVPELSLAISSVPVEAEARKLKAKWTIESQQDLRAYHGLDAEPELMAAVSDELVREIDRTMIDDVVAGVPVGNQFTFEKATPTAGAYSSIDPKIYKRLLWEKIVDANNAIFKARYVNAAWIVAGADFATWLEKLDEFAANPNADPAQWAILQGAHYFGTLGSRWTVYKDPWLDADTALMGYKGPTFMHAGYVYSPYIPVFTTPPLTDPEDFTTRRGMMSRFARTMVIDEMYASIELI